MHECRCIQSISIWLRAAEVSGRLPMKCLLSTPSPHHKLLCNSSVDLQRKYVLQLLLLSVYLKKSSLNQNKEKLFIWTEVHFSAQDYKHNSFAFLWPRSPSVLLLLSPFKPYITHIVLLTLCSCLALSAQVNLNIAKVWNCPNFWLCFDNYFYLCYEGNESEENCCSYNSNASCGEMSTTRRWCVYSK